MLGIGLFIGLFLGRKVLCAKSDPLNFISDATIFGFFGAFARYGFTLTTIDRMSGWILLLASFYFGDKVRRYLFARKAQNDYPGLDTQFPIEKK